MFLFGNYMCLLGMQCFCCGIDAFGWKGHVSLRHDMSLFGNEVLRFASLMCLLEIAYFGFEITWFIWNKKGLLETVFLLGSSGVTFGVILGSI